jgi:16S rRNA (guanine1516-N2)-methyltransferase
MEEAVAVVAVAPVEIYAGLLEHLGIESVEAAPEDAFVLIERAYGLEYGLELRPPGESDRRGIRAVFPPDPESQSVGARGPLAKAFGKRVHTILDGTAGLGADAYRLASAGYTVHAWERHPALFALLVSNWGAAVAAGSVPRAITSRLSFQWGDGASALTGFDGLDLGAYFDPMYPTPRKTSSLPKRPLQILRQLLGEDAATPGQGASLEDSIARARETCSRVVVKRPHHAAPLLEGADFEVSTKLVRFDVYLNPARMASEES